MRGKRREVPDGGVQPDQRMLRHKERLRKLRDRRAAGGGRAVQNHIVVHRQEHFPRCGVILLLRDEHALRLFDQNRGKTDAVLAVGTQTVGEEAVQLAAQSVAVRLLHRVKLPERGKGLVRQRLNRNGSHGASSVYTIVSRSHSRVQLTI